ncbi:helix-turn-helix domain-containing protein [Streptomyces sp. NPDC005648]|uniref:AraC-like ligand-binding domain-containing protein n=1 Tax=Streptomyces sp. NPDC005648 TaxID=3157044 RepID=UPI0033A4FAC6
MRSEDLPAPDRFQWWREQCAKGVVPTVASSPHAGDFRATVTFAELGPLQLSVLTFPEVRAVRTPALVRRSDPEEYGLSLITANDLWFAQRDRDCRLEPGRLLLHDTSQPFDSRALPGSGPGGMLMLQIPRTALPLRPRRLDQLLARGLPTRAGMDAILARYLTGVADAVENGEVGEREAGQLGRTALDLVAATLATHLGDEEHLTPETRRQALLARIEAFIELNLGDPELTPTTIAAHHHISPAYLHRLFQPRELTVAAWIRHQRLERARVDLADPRQRLRPVHAIAARWGFRHPAEFSRTFRTAHGVPPSDYRHHALTAGTTEPDRRAPAPRPVATPG